jgi:hypothetical protein
MYPETRTFWLEETSDIAAGLRRYARTGDGWTCDTGYHSALVYTGVEPAVFTGNGTGRVLAARLFTPRDDPRWPTTCRCGYQFPSDCPWQDWQELIYRRADTGDLVILRERQASDVGGPDPAPPGAMWDAWWMRDAWRGPEGIALMVRLPNGRDWFVDGRASNCTHPDDNSHRCWVRHGDPRTGRVTVDKDGDTCGAGAGSIQAEDYHGFLRDGRLTAG